MKKKLLSALVLVLIIPILVSYFKYPATHLPPGFGEFPPDFVSQPPGFNIWIFGLITVLGLIVLSLFIFPQWFGFKKVTPNTKPTRSTFPAWFWLGLLVMSFFWYLMWARPVDGVLKDWVFYAFTPMWWGFIFVLDGLCYRLSGGYSLFAKKPSLLIISAVLSLIGWTLFEYLDYFSLGNWFYPYSTKQEIPLSHKQIVWIFLIAYTTVWPALFQWYTILNQFPKLVARYKQGPKIKLNGKICMLLGFVLMALTVWAPYPFFWALWISPILIFGGLLIELNINSPLSEIAEGNWSNAFLMAISSILNGFLWEAWNYGSSHPELPISNPNYWVYSVPYVNVIHVFSEMPLLGYLGYLPFGILTYIMFIYSGTLFGFKTDLLDKK